MTISDLAGQAAPKEMLVDPSRPEREYYARKLGSEVWPCIESYEELTVEGIRSRVVSMPSWELFEHYCRPFDPARGLRFDPEKLLVDPYGRAVVVPERYDRAAASRPGDNTAVAMRSVIVDPESYDWEGDAPLRQPFATTVIYEMHVAGFTRHPSSGVTKARRGTYAGMIEKIPYLQDLGITAVELLPVFQFDRQDCPPGLVNYWGYSPVSFFAPHAGYSSRRDPLGPVDEFRDLVKALHRAGIEVILDVVYNHTAEGNHEGPTLFFRGLDNNTYYILEPDRARYANYTGTGNTLNANESVVRRLILDSLRYWVAQMHVDGFRFDLASVLTRDESGRPLERPPVLWDIQSDAILAGTKLIAEAWDAAGLYQVGSFIGDTWLEWNGKFRDDVRRFLKSDSDTVVAFGYRCFGSPDVYGHEERGPEQSINFVTCHDGFTLNDLVSYNDKHNEANGEGGRDGTDANLSWNCGIEGATNEAAVERLRLRQVKNFLAVTLLSLGTPMLLMGDEVRRTQGGNNNAYCQDNEISWFDWTLLERHRELRRFVKTLIGQRLAVGGRPAVQGLSLNELLRRGAIEVHGVRLQQPDLSPESHSVAITVRNVGAAILIHTMFNAYWEPLIFELPPLRHQPWPLVTRLERHRVPRGVAIGLLLLGFVLATLGIANGIRAAMPSDTEALELRIRALYTLNRRYEALMGLDRSLTGGNWIYRLVHSDLDPLVDHVNQWLALTPEEHAQFLASRPRGAHDAPPGSDRPSEYHRANVDTLARRARTALAEPAPGSAARPAVAPAPASAAQTPLVALADILSTWMIAPLMFLFLLRDTGEIKRGLLRAVPNRLFEPALTVLADLDRALGNYVRGIFLECCLLGLTVVLLLTVVGVPLRWTIGFGIISGASNVVPYMGFAVALLSGLAYALLAEDIHPLLPIVSTENFAIWVIVAVALAELLKNVVYEPVVLGGAVKLHPIVVVIGVLGGAILFGGVGMLLAIPAITVFKAFVSSTARQLKAYGLV